MTDPLTTTTTSWRDRAKRRKVDSTTSTSTVISPTLTAVQTHRINTAPTPPHRHTCDTHHTTTIDHAKDAVQSDMCDADLQATHFAGLDDSNGEVLPTFLANYLTELHTHPHTDGGATQPTSATTAKPDRAVSGSADINALSAQAMKAKLKRNMTLYNELQQQIATLRAQQKPLTPAVPNTVELNQLNQHNIPFSLQQKSGTSNGNVRDMARAERVSNSAAQYDKQQMNAILRNKAYKQQSTDDTFDMYDVGKLNDRFDVKPSDDVVRQQQIQQTVKGNRQEQRCAYCHINAAYVVSTGINTVLTVALSNRVISNQMTLTVASHVTRFDLTSSVTDEVQYTKQCLSRAYAAHGQALVFMESFASTAQSHYRIDICTVDAAELSEVRLSYLQELQQMDANNQNTRNVIDLGKTQQSVQQALHSAQVSYYLVQFGESQQNAYLHVCDPNEQFDALFGLRVLCGHTGESPELLLRNKPVARDLAAADVKAVKVVYDQKYDWTHKLKRNK